MAGLLIVFLAFSCKGETKKEETSLTEQPVLAENLEEVRFEIYGMTCEIGCAKMVEYRLENAKGVDSANVDFKTNLAYISFDKTR